MPHHPQPAGAMRLPRPTTVPYIAARSDELGGFEVELTVRRDGRGVGYGLEREGDRDARGVLWARVSTSDGTGRPLFDQVHPTRQRKCVELALCQVCAKPASRTKKGTLFLTRRESAEHMWAAWPDGCLTMQPPLCVPCARIAVEQCHHLIGRYVAIRARKTRLHGVFGTLYVPGLYGTVRAVDDRGQGVTLPYTDPAARWLLASQMVCELRRCTVVDLTSE
ncbi:MAG: hypothetical protein JO362_22305 [Streptomycetaceae bacterium]|nr:hypothetical protein [Streptomycetaceae bacterium]